MKSVFVAMFAGAIGCVFVRAVPAAEVPKGERVLYSFCGQANCADGSQPFGGLIDMKGTLYSTTGTGGSNGGGTVFAFDRKTGVEKVLYSFCQQQNCADGQLPITGLIDVKGVLYGTTNLGGTYGGGTVFAFDTSTGAERVLYSFCSQANCTDGQAPNASLINVNSKLYGTTFYGGTSDQGTVFVVDPRTGAEKVLHSFCSQQNCADGQYPNASLIDLNGTLYSTTTGGGIIADGCATGCGTVFALDPGSGAETVLYAFCQQQNCADGQASFSSPINVNGTLFGTTAGGGTFGWGTAFSLDLSTGAGTVLHSFGGGTDGRFPEASLIDVNGTLYGTTPEGGAHNNAGVVFALDLNTGTENVLHSFCGQQNCSDGESPDASLIDVNGKLFSTTLLGGAYGDGTVFAVKMP